MDFSTLLTLLRDSSKKLPQLRYAWGLLGLSTVAALIVKILGATKASIITLSLTVIGFVLVFLITVSFGKKKLAHWPAVILTWAITCFFTIFLLFTVTAFACSWPCNWVNFLGIVTPDCHNGPELKETAVRIDRIADFSGTGFKDGNRVYKAIYTDTLTFSNTIDYYDAQAISYGPDHKCTISYFIDDRELIPISESDPLYGQSEVKRAKIRVNGTMLKVRYTYEQQPDPEDKEWGLSFVSSLPINGITTTAILPPDKQVCSLDETSRTYNKALFRGCQEFRPGNPAKLVCDKKFNVPANTPFSLPWKWDVWDKCEN